MGGTNKTITIKKCSNCGKDVEIKHKKRLEAINTFCCKECESKYKKKQVVYNCKCSFCNKKIHVKPNLLEKYKTHFCSKECFSKYKKDYFKGENNHQYGLKGELNKSFKSNEKITNYGYKKIRALCHPFKDCDGFMLEHRLMQKNFY